jgi:predicted  nucleic acid-binding Zn ribbon protein
MDTVQLLFRTRAAKAAKKEEDLLDKVQSYVAALMHNGQIVGDHTPMANVSGGILVTASLPEADALGDRFANKWVRKSLRELSAAGVDRPKVTHLGADPESRKPCRCRKRPFLIIFTTFLNAEPPLRCGTCFGPVALYKPRHQRSRESPGHPVVAGYVSGDGLAVHRNRARRAVCPRSAVPFR